MVLPLHHPGGGLRSVCTHEARDYVQRRHLRWILDCADRERGMYMCIVHMHMHIFICIYIYIYIHIHIHIHVKYLCILDSDVNITN